MVYSQKNLLTLIIRWSLFTVFLWLVFFSHIGSALMGTTPWSEVLNYSHLLNILIGPFWSALIIILLAKEGKKDLWVIYLFFISFSICAIAFSMSYCIAEMSLLIIVFCFLETFFKKEVTENSLLASESVVIIFSLFVAIFYGIEIGSACLFIFSAICLLTMVVGGTIKAIFSFVSSIRLYGHIKNFLLGKDLAE